MNNKIYVINLSQKDYSSAEEYGDTIFMTEGILNLKRIDYYKKIFERHLANATDNDYLLFSGPAVICALAVKVWYSCGNKTKCKILTWNKAKAEYNLNEI